MTGAEQQHPPNNSAPPPLDISAANNNTATISNANTTETVESNNNRTTTTSSVEDLISDETTKKSVIDLKEFASLIKNFPESILRSILDIYHQQEERKKQHEVKNEGDELVWETSLTSKLLVQDQYKHHDFFFLPKDYMTVVDKYLPQFLQNSHEYQYPVTKSAMEEFKKRHGFHPFQSSLSIEQQKHNELLLEQLEPHLQYAFQYLLSGHLQFYTKNYIGFEMEPLDEDLEYKAKLNLSKVNHQRLSLDNFVSNLSGITQGLEPGASMVQNLLITGQPGNYKQALATARNHAPNQSQHHLQQQASQQQLRKTATAKPQHNASLNKVKSSQPTAVTAVVAPISTNAPTVLEPPKTNTFIHLPQHLERIMAQQAQALQLFIQQPSHMRKFVLKPHPLVMIGRECGLSTAMVHELNQDVVDQYYRKYRPIWRGMINYTPQHVLQLMHQSGDTSVTFETMDATTSTTNTTATTTATTTNTEVFAEKLFDKLLSQQQTTQTTQTQQTAQTTQEEGTSQENENPNNDEDNPLDYMDNSVMDIPCDSDSPNYRDGILNDKSVKRILSLYDPYYQYKPIQSALDLKREDPIPLPFSINSNQQKVLITCQRLVLDMVGKLEPLYCSISLYDVKSRQKVSENFSFVINVENQVLKQGQIELFDFHYQLMNNEKMKRAIFSIKEPSPSLFVVLWIEKILQHNQGTDVYLQNSSKKHSKTLEEQVKQQAVTRIKDAYEYLQYFRQPLMWAFEPLYEINHNNTTIDAVVNTTATTATASSTSQSENVVESTSATSRPSIGSIFERVSLGDTKDYTRSTSIASATSASNRESMNSYGSRDSTGSTGGGVGGKDSFAMNAPGSTLSNEKQTTTSGSSMGGSADKYKSLKLRSGLISFRDLYPVEGASGKDRFEICDMILERRADLLNLMSNTPSSTTTTTTTAKSNTSSLKKILGSFSMEVESINTEESIEKYLTDVQKNYPNKKAQALRDEWDDLDHLHNLRKQEFHMCHPLQNSISYSSPLHLHFQHSLFLYPDNGNFSKVNIKGVAIENIAIRVFLKENDLMEDGMNVFVADYSRNFRSVEYQKFQISSVIYNEKYPQFFNEMRIDLPLKVTKQHHLLFEFYNIKTEKPKQQQTTSQIQPSSQTMANQLNQSIYHIPTQMEHVDWDTKMGKADKTLIGYSVVRLCDMDLLKDGKHALPVYKKLVPYYLGILYKDTSVTSATMNNGSSMIPTSVSSSSSSQQQQQQQQQLQQQVLVLEPLNSGKPIFRFNTLFKSSLYAPDEKAISFVRASSNLVEKTTIASTHLSTTFGTKMLPVATDVMNQLQTVTEWNRLIPYIPSVINLLLYSMSNMKGSSNTSKYVERDTQLALNSAFETMLGVIKGTLNHMNSSLEKRDAFLFSSYIEYFFMNPNKSIKPIYRSIVEQWIQFVNICQEREKLKRAEKLAQEFLNSTSSTPAPISSNANSNANNTPTTPTSTKPNTNNATSSAAAARARTASLAPNQNPYLMDLYSAVDTTSSNTSFDNSTVTVLDSLKMSWFLFDLIIKSMILVAAPNVQHIIEEQREKAKKEQEQALAKANESSITLPTMIPTSSMSFRLDDSSMKDSNNNPMINNSSLANNESIRRNALDDSDVEELHQHQHHPAEEEEEEEEDEYITSIHDENQLFNEPENEMMMAWTPQLLGTDSTFFASLRELQRKIVEMLVDLHNGVRDNILLARKVNYDLALFVRDLLSISFQPSMLPYNAFRQNIYNLLEDYILASEIKKSALIIRFRLDFLEIFVDHENFMEYCACTSNFYLAQFVIDVICKTIMEQTGDRSQDSKTRAINILLYRILIKADYNSKYQHPNQRNSISKTFYPFIARLLDNEELLKSATQNPNDKLKIMLIVIHILKNRNRNEWYEWFWIINKKDKTKRLRPMRYLCAFMNLLTQVLLTIIENPVKIVRKSVKLACLDIFDYFVHQFAPILNRTSKDLVVTSVAQYTIVHDYSSVSAMESLNALLDELVAFVVQFLYLNDKDQEYTEKLFLPRFKDFIKICAPALCANDRDTNWQLCVGSFLKFIEYPLEDNHNEELRKCIASTLDCLLEPYSERLQYEEMEKKELLDFKLLPDDEKTIFVEDGIIKGATLDKLIERVTSDKDGDQKLRELFFLTYRSFTKPLVLLYKLIGRLRLSLEQDPNGGDKITLRVINCIKLWVDRHFYDFNSLIITKLLVFLREEASQIPKIKQFSKNLKKTICSKLMTAEKKDMNSNNNQYTFSKKPPPAIIPKNYIKDYEFFSLLEWSPIEFARQLTLVDYEYFKRIEPREFSSGAWTKIDLKYKVSPNIAILTDRWNDLTNWTCAQILKSDDIKLRRAFITKFIEIAEYLRAPMANFHAVTAIMAALSTTSIYRLTKTWEGLSESTMTTYKSLEQLVNQQNANKSMRETLMSTPPPSIPPLQMYLRDVVFIVDGNSDIIKGGLINVHKRRLLSKQLFELNRYQQQPYHFEKVNFLRGYILNHIPMEARATNEDALYERSLSLQPRQVAQ